MSKPRTLATRRFAQAVEAKLAGAAVLPCPHPGMLSHPGVVTVTIRDALGLRADGNITAFFGGTSAGRGR